MYGFPIGCKWVVCSISHNLDPSDYSADYKLNIPILQGLITTGAPDGSVDFQHQTIADVINDSVSPTFDAVTTLKKAQICQNSGPLVANLSFFVFSTCSRG
jgi:hypothetical protein